MEYHIEAVKIPSGVQIYLDNFEKGLRSFVANEIKSHTQLGVTLKWYVSERGESFWRVESNADISISDSLSVQSRINDYLKRNLQVDFPECSLSLKVTYRTLSPEESNNSMPQNTTNDGLPDFIPQKPRFTFDQIILPDDTRKRIFNDLNTIKYQDLIYNQWGFAEVDSKPKSILNFYGPPGTGKTMCAHAIANMLGKPLLALNYSEIESKYVGDAAKNLKKAFDTARGKDAVMFFDEADSFLGRRIENVTQGSDQALNSLRSQMLILLEEYEGVVIFATNLVTNFDKAFESRILDHIKLELPNREARAEIIDKMLPSRLPMEHRPTKEELLEVSDTIDGFAGREIKGAILTMLLDKAGLEEADPCFTLEDLRTALIKKKDQIDKLKKEETDHRKEKIAKRLQEKLEEDAEYEKRRRTRTKDSRSARR